MQSPNPNQTKDFEWWHEPTIEELKPSAKKMVEYIQKNGIEVIVVSGTSGQSAAYMVKSAWKLMYPNSPMPKFVATGTVKKEKQYFIVPTGKNTLTTTLPGYIQNKPKTQLLQSHLPEVMAKMRKEGHKIIRVPIFVPVQTKTIGINAIEQKLRKSMRTTPKTAKIFIMEESTASGNSMRDMVFLLKRMGFSQIKTGTLYRQKRKIFDTAFPLDFIGTVGEELFSEMYRTRRYALRNILTKRAQRHAEMKMFGHSTTREDRDTLKELRKKLRVHK